MHIKVQPQDDEEATHMLASNTRHLATADVPAPKVIIPIMQPVEQSDSQAKVIRLLPCLFGVSDMLLVHYCSLDMCQQITAKLNFDV